MRRILIIILAIVLVGGGVWYFYIRPKEQGTSSPVPNILKPFFPKSVTTTGSFGDDTSATTGEGSGQGNTSAKTPVFKQLTGKPVAGYSVYTDTTDHVVRYVSRVNGYVYEIRNGAIPLQISNILIPNIYEAYFADNNTTAIERFLRDDNETIATYSIPIPPLNTDGTRTQKSGTYLPDNIYDMAVSPDQTQIVRVTADKAGGVVTTSSTTGKLIKTLLHSPFVEWLPSWSGTTVYLQTKAAAVADGFLYGVVQPSARLSRIVGGVSGMTTSISPSGTYVLYSETTANGFITHLLNTKTNTTTNVGLNILPEKCTWLQNEDLICAGNTTIPNGAYPDAWYAGTLHFSDQLYRITTGSNLYTILYDGASHSFDMTTVKVDESQHLIYFVDKNTGFLWQFTY